MRVRGRGTRAGVAWLVVVAVLAAGALAAAGPGGGASPSKPVSAETSAKKTSVRVLTRTQRGARRSSSVRIRLRARRASRVRLTAVVPVRAGGFPIVRPRTVRGGRSGSRRVTLKLTPAGRRLLRICGRFRVVVTARRPGGTRRLTRGFRRLSPDRALCPAGVTPPLGEQVRIDIPRGGSGGPGDPAPQPSPGVPDDYDVRPGQAARHVNGTARAFSATRLGGASKLDLALFACARVNASGARFTFDQRDGRALQGPTASVVKTVNGEAAPSGRDFIRDAEVKDGEMKLEIDGTNTCARPVLFADRNGNDALDVDGGGRPKEPFGVGGSTTFEELGTPVANPTRCDFLDPAHCLFPFPNDHFTVADATKDTKLRVNLSSASMPKNQAGKPFDPAEINRNDGFSPGSKIVTKVPGLETPAAFQRTGAVPITDMERSFDPRQPVVIINARTGERQLIFSELDANPTASDPERTGPVNLIIRPGKNFEEGERYIVALRNLRKADGSPIPVRRPFELYRDRVISSNSAVEGRRERFEGIFDTLGSAGIDRDDLYLAWDFTIESERGLSERMLGIRDDAFKQLGDTNLADLQVQGSSPLFTVDPTKTQEFPPCGSDGCAKDLTGKNDIESDTIARRVEGTVLVPCYLDQPECPPGSKFNYAGSSDGLPRQLPGNMHAANFICNIPRRAVDGPGVQRARPSLYGHGLLGGASEVGAGNVKAMGNEHNFVFCATDWIGMSTQDLPNVGTILADLSRFPTLVDRVQQSQVNFMYLGRAMIHPQGFGANPAFQDEGQSVIDGARLFYDGNSQGGIIGGSLTAVAPDFDRAVLGVPGMNYSTLLRRSVDFDAYANLPVVGLYNNYRDELERPLVLSLIQQIWDRSEANGYAQHMTSDPYPNTPPHEVLLHPAFGDHQVADVTAEIEARTIGAAARRPALLPRRHTSVDPLFGIPPIGTFPFSGSALVYWDTGPLPLRPKTAGQPCDQSSAQRTKDTCSGTPSSPTTNLPPRRGVDPHSAPRNSSAARQQKSDFLRIGGQVTNPCGPMPCFADGYTGTPAP